MSRLQLTSRSRGSSGHGRLYVWYTECVSRRESGGTMRCDARRWFHSWLSSSARKSGIRSEMCLSTTVSWTASSCREGMEEEEAASDGAAISASAAILGKGVGS